MIVVYQEVNPADLETQQLRLLVYRYLRDVGFLMPLKLAPDGHHNVVKIACPDDRSFMTEASWIEDLHKRHNRRLSVMPRPLFGGAMRFSEYCPEMPDEVLGFKSSPNVVHCQVTIEAIRSGIRFRSVHLAKAGGHGLFCGWATALGLSLFQHTRLTIDGRQVIKDMAKRQRWVKDGEFEVFAAHHMDCLPDGTESPRTYALNHRHPLIERYTMEMTMDLLCDRRFLEIEAPDLLREYERTTASNGGRPQVEPATVPAT